MSTRYVFLTGLMLGSCTPVAIPSHMHHTLPLPAEEIPAKPAVSLEKEVENRVKECPQTKELIVQKQQETISPEYRALLDTIAWAEGTDCHYNMMMGRMLFRDYTAHPLETGEMPEKGYPFKIKRKKHWKVIYSTAAGRYQFLHRTYKALQQEGFFQSGFSPEEQDQAAIYLIHKNEVTQKTLDEAVQEDNTTQQQEEFIEIWHRLSGTWASLPHRKTKRSRYAQFANKSDDLQKIFFIYYEQHKK